MVIGFGAGLVFLVLGIMLVMMKSAVAKKLDMDTDDVDFTEVEDDIFVPPPVAAAPVPTTSSSVPTVGAVRCDATPYLRHIFEIFNDDNPDAFNDLEAIDLAQKHAAIAQNYKDSGLRRHTELIMVNTQQDTLYEQANQYEYVTSEISATVRDKIIDLSSGNTVGGDDSSTYQVKYVLIFARPEGEEGYALMRASLVQ
jgi:hypothetical protein